MQVTDSKAEGAPRGSRGYLPGVTVGAGAVSRRATRARCPQPHVSTIRPWRSHSKRSQARQWGQWGGPPSSTRRERAAAWFTCGGM